MKLSGAFEHKYDKSSTTAAAMLLDVDLLCYGVVCGSSIMRHVCGYVS